MILLAILLPPVAVLLCGKPVQALLNCVLCLFLWIPGIIHAVIVVNNRNADLRQKAALEAQQAMIAAQTAALIAAQESAQVTAVTPEMPTPPAAPTP